MLNQAVQGNLKSGASTDSAELSQARTAQSKELIDLFDNEGNIV